MYRIHFDPRCSQFVVQFLVWGCFWETCMHMNQETKKSTSTPYYFETYADAAKWVSDKGIPEGYEIQPPKKSIYNRLSAA